MPRYARQLDGYSCGPVAIINAMKALGYKYTLKDVKRIGRLCETCKVKGTGTLPIFHFLRNQGLSVRLRYGIKSKDIKKELGKGNIVIACGSGFGKDKKCDHWFLIDGFSEGKFTVINYYDNEAVSLIDTETLSKTFVKPESAIGIIIRKD